MRASVIRTRAIIGIGAAALALAACGGGYGSDEPSTAADESDAAAAPEAAADAPVGRGDTGLGTVLVDAEGLTLYGLTDDTGGVPSCDGACAEAWPPLTVDGPDLSADLDPGLYSVVERSDGTFQLAAGDLEFQVADAGLKQLIIAHVRQIRRGRSRSAFAFTVSHMAILSKGLVPSHINVL